MKVQMNNTCNKGRLFLYKSGNLSEVQIDFCFCGKIIDLYSKYCLFLLPLLFPGGINSFTI